MLPNACLCHVFISQCNTRLILLCLLNNYFLWSFLSLSTYLTKWMQLQFLWIFLNQEILSKCADIKGAIEKKWRPSTCGNKSRATVTCHHEEKLLIVKKTRPKMTETSQKRGNLLPYSTKFLGLRIPTTISAWRHFTSFLYEEYFGPLTLTLDNLAFPDVWRVILSCRWVNHAHVANFYHFRAEIHDRSKQEQQQ